MTPTNALIIEDVHRTMRYGEILDLENNSADLNWSSKLGVSANLSANMINLHSPLSPPSTDCCPGSTVASCRLEGQRNVAECNVSGLAGSLIFTSRVFEDV